MIEARPSPQGWKRLERELQLSRYRTPWRRRVAFWRGLAGAATAALLFGIGFQFLRPVETEPAPVEIAQLEGKGEAARVTAALSRDRSMLQLSAARPVVAGPAQSYELWLLPAEGGPPVSLAVLGNLERTRARCARILAASCYGGEAGNQRGARPAAHLRAARPGP